MDRVVVLPISNYCFFLPFPSKSPSSLLKLPNVAVFVPGVFPAVHVMDRNMFITKLRLFNFPVNSTEQLYAVFNFSFLTSSEQ